MSDPDMWMIVGIMLGSTSSSNKKDMLNEKRNEAYSKCETIMTWDDASNSQLIRNGDTAVFAFDSFLNETVDHFKWSLDYAKDNGIKRFVLDVSCNTGGNSDAVMYMIAVMTGSNEAAIRSFMTIDGNITRDDFRLDLNLDGEINDLDKEVKYDFEYAVLTSGISFSCGNLLPSLAKNNGIAVIGETSGSGSCSLLFNFTPEVFPYTLSGFNKLISVDNKDIDSGITPDYALTKEITNEFGMADTDYSGLYDIVAYSTLIDEFYGVTDEPSEEPSEEPADEPTEEPADDNSVQQSDTPSQQTSVTPSESGIPATGDSNFAVIALLSVITSCAVITLTVLIRKRED